VFLENGYAGATIDLVVARAGASKATIYSFFGGKEGLFSAIVAERAERVLTGFPDGDIENVDARTALADSPGSTWRW
jgi:AcrR family transcriptional regulator